MATLEDTLKLPDFFAGSSGPSTGISPITSVLIVLGLVIIVGGILFWYYYKKSQTKIYKFNINLFRENAEGKPEWIAGDKAKELKIKGTNVRILYWKSSKLYSAYPTRSMGPNVYAYKINRFGELTNFDLGKGDDATTAKIDYDHRDQTYAYLHLQSLISKNYRDKNVKWWKENIGVITIVVLAVLLGIEMWFFFSQSGKQLTQWTLISENMKIAAQTIADAVQQSKNLGSGVVTG